MKHAPIVCVVLLAMSPSIARAQSKGDDMPDFMRKPVEASRRRGFTFGLVGAPSMYWSSATPVDYVKRSSAYEVRASHAIAPSISGFLGVAFADEASFTLAVEPALARHGDIRTSGIAFAFRIETWPLVKLGGVFRDLGIAGKFGLGSANFRRISTGETLASSGGYSLVGVDLLWDALRIGGLGIGPTAGVTYRFSATYEETDLTLGLRVAFYAGP